MAYKLDAIDKRILFELDKNARIPDTQLAKLVRKSKESIRYRINKLKEENIILGFTIWIDPVKLGYQTAKIYLSLANVPEKKKKFIEYIKQDKRLFWLGIAEGAWNAGLTFFVKSNAEFFDLKNNIFTKFKDLILESHTASLVSVHYHDRTFLHQEKTSWKTLFNETKDHKIDDISIKILKALFRNSRENIASIAHDNNTTVDIIKNRIKKLEQEKIISRYLAVLNYQKLGYEFYKTFLYFKNLNDTDLQNLMSHCESHPNIIHLVKQISPWDIELEIMCQSYEQYNEIISGLTAKFSGIINKVETAIMGEDYVFPAKEMVFE
ncbi:MAG: Lrp/AsnC family transcriptional regulator [Nanoarchaeota archaeon]|nr:Lrp/AsnC family transcriptional regulator [Nanoarchaeota archaeon]